jgi:hypothetical protein
LVGRTEEVRIRNPRSVVTSAIAGATVLCIATVAAAGSKSAHKPDLTGRDRASNAIIRNQAAHPDSTGLSGALSNASDQTGGAATATGLARAIQVVTAAQSAQAPNMGLATALSHLQANAAAHPTGRSH